MPKFRAAISFELDTPKGYRLDSRDVKELSEFITDALESWGGQRHPDDWLFGSLENVKVERLRQLAHRAKAAKLV